MTRKQAVMRDLLSVIKALGWDVSLHDSGDGLVAGTGTFVRSMTGAMGAVEGALRATGQLVYPGDPETVILAPSDQPVDKPCSPGSGDSEQAIDAPAEANGAGDEGAENRGETPGNFGQGAYRELARMEREEHPDPFMPDAPEEG